MAPVDPRRRDFLRRAFLGMGALGATSVFGACGRDLRYVPEGRRGTRAVPTPAMPAELSGREARYAGGTGDPGPVRVVPDPVLEGDGRFDPPGAGADDFGDLDAGAGPRKAARARGITLQAADAHGIELPEGFAARIVGRSGEAPVPGGSYIWHSAPDGGATFALSDGGHIYVSNSEITGGGGGVGALRFDARAQLVDAYGILSGTTRNCAGGATPWGTWISCEEIQSGLCWECDPLGIEPGIARPALGVFNHEAVAVDLARAQVYLTEDMPDGRLYRFTSDRVLPDGALDLDSGVLEVLEVVSGSGGALRWHALPDPSASVTPTRQQVPESRSFAGGEGIWYDREFDVVFFTTKLDNRVWALDIPRAELVLLYAADRFDMPTLTGVDNITMAPSRHLLVAEDEGNRELALLDAMGTPHVLLRVLDQEGSELCGPAFDVSGTRLYFSSQRGQRNGNLGITYEVRGPFADIML